MGKAVEIDVLVREPGWLEDCPGAVDVCRRAAAHAWTCGAGATAAAPQTSIVLTNDHHITELNRTYRGKDEPTDVLSFEMEGLAEAMAVEAAGRSVHLGDIVIARETAARDAQREGRPLADHLSHLVVHGMLHLLGFDHDSDEQATAMEGLEVRVLSGLDISNPYGTADG